ncbi:MAG: hypothetical protein Q4D80_01250 [Pseudomonadota bacterium]|nr:hypothetical protein [Pseudomonadota bacterium]
MKKVLMLCLLALVCVSCQSNVEEISAEPVYSSDAERFYRNISTKAMGEDYVVYEYMDVRIDDVATLASRYCFETTEGKKAYLRDIYMYKNHKRRATFDCVNLAAE